MCEAFATWCKNKDFKGYDRLSQGTFSRALNSILSDLFPFQKLTPE